MEHENFLPATEFWQDIQQAVEALQDPDPEAWRRHLQSAADRLLAAREVLYPVTIYLLDICLLETDRLNEPLPAAFERGSPMTIMAAAVVLEELGRRHPERLAMLRDRVGA